MHRGYRAYVKEDVLEQIVDDYLQHLGYFTTHNVRFKPRANHPDFVSRADSVSSDIDVVGYNPKIDGVERVMVVSCKAWQRGFDPAAGLADLHGEKGERGRLRFRELCIPKWSAALRDTISEITGATKFSYRIAVTRLREGDPSAWNTDPTIQVNLPGCDLGFLTLEEMWARVLAEITTTPASSEIGRLAQLLKAAGLTAPEQVREPAGPDAGSDAEAEELGSTD